MSNTCAVCDEPAKKNNATCGARHCINVQTLRRRTERAPEQQLQEMKRMYGADNPWTQWLRDAIRKRS